MRRVARSPILAALDFAALLLVLGAGVAQAAPTRVQVRIEGKRETLFEGPILTDGHGVEASSDTKQRACDGVNPLDPQNLAPGPTPTAASADAMGILGESFDGKWYEGFNDYFITRWGPDREAEGESWGILVNNVFTNVGGCQYELSSDDEVLWVYNAFESRPFLALFPAGDGDGAPALTATAGLNQPFEIEVVAYDDDQEDEPPASPERTGSAPYAGADVAPVQTSAKGFQRVATESPQAVSTNAQGKASITFTEPGWHRIKAAVAGASEEEAIRSNRLDVCVPVKGESDCGAAPAEDLVRAPPASEQKAREHAEAIEREEEARRQREQEASRREALEREQQARREAEARSGGAQRSEAAQRLAQGTSSGVLGATATPPASSTKKMLLTYDDRWRGLHYRGRVHRRRQPGAWLDTVTRLTAGASAAAHLAAGRPVFRLRATPAAARVEVRSGSIRQVFAIARGTGGTSRVLTAANRAHAGTVTLRVLRGTIDLDDLAVAP